MDRMSPVALGVTSLQGSYGKATPEGEIELTEHLIQKYDIEWPILFSDRPVNDPAYAATTLPTYAIIDRAGNVDRVLVGSFEGLGKQIIERLIATEQGFNQNRRRTERRER